MCIVLHAASLLSPLLLQLHSLGREHGKLKAAHMKLANEARQREDNLARTAADKDRVEQVHRSAAEAHQIQASLCAFWSPLRDL